MPDGGAGPWGSPRIVFGEDRNHAGPLLRERNQRFGHRHRGVEVGRDDEEPSGDESDRPDEAPAGTGPSQVTPAPTGTG